MHPKPEIYHRSSLCTNDGACIAACPNGAIRRHDAFGIYIDRAKCEECGACIDACIPGALSTMGRSWDVDEIVAKVKRDAPFYRNSGGGVTLSGGEVFAQPDAALELLQKLSRSRIHTAVETGGCVDWDCIEACLPFLDLVLYDVKHMDSGKHKDLTGIGNERILENLAWLGETGKKVWIRAPIVPGCNDDAESVLKVAEIANRVKGLEKIELLPYHPYGSGKYAGVGKAYALSGLEAPDKATMESLRDRLQKVVQVPVI
jgi:pyruvate formate lyase activating enzyme